MYSLIGKNVRVHLYTVDGLPLGVISGRVADVAAKVEVAPGMRKDLAYVIDIEVPDSDVPYRNSSGTESEGWFALQDIEIIENKSQPRWFVN